MGSRVYFGLAWWVLAAAALCGEANGFQPLGLADLPDFTSELEERVTKCGRVHVDGLVSTINCEQFDKPKVEYETKLKLPRERTGFRKDLELRVRWQPERAPLAIPLLGFAGENNQALARAWQGYLYAAGCHVASFDSLFLSQFNEALSHGVAGNMEEEAKIVGRIVDNLLAWRPDGESAPLRERVSCVRLLGTSYGGILALNVRKLPQAAQWPLDRVLALSPPIKLSTAARLVDQYQQEDRPKFQPSLMKLLGGYTPDKNLPSDREKSLIRAGIAYDFHGALVDILSKSEDLYLTDLRKKFKHEEKLEELQTGKKPAHRLSDFDEWTFQDYVERVCAPYWNTTPEKIWGMAELETLLADAPDYVQAVVTADDPLNDPQELDALRQRLHNPKLLVLPHGGHLGYTGTKWVKALIGRYFKP